MSHEKMMRVQLQLHRGNETELTEDQFSKEELCIFELQDNEEEEEEEDSTNELKHATSLTSNEDEYGHVSEENDHHKYYSLKKAIYGLVTQVSKHI